MQIVVISPESADTREIPAVGGLFEAGLERYHVRKPSWESTDLEAWLRALPRDWRTRLILHGHRTLAQELQLGGWHDRDRKSDGSPAGVSRSCHDLPSLRRHLPAYPAILFGPVFPSLSKPGYGPVPGFPWGSLTALLRERGPGDARVLAIGGVTARGLGRCRELGFDGAAVLGAVWGSPDPLRSYAEIRDEAARLEVARHAA
jgi:thiamine-phosphate pyrophosphorylase